MSGINKTITVGRLGKDPELRYTTGKMAVCKIVVATSEKYTRKDNHETVETTEWHRITIWGKMGENAHKYLTKGSQVYVEGKLKTSTFEKEGVKHWATEIVAEKVQYLSSANTDKKEGDSKPKPSSNESSNDSGPPDSFEEPGFETNGGDDDIPF